LREHEDAIAAVRASVDVPGGYLRLGCGPHASVCIVPHLLRALLRALPDVLIDNVTGESTVLLHELREGRLDVLLMSRLERDWKDLKVTPLWQHERVFVVAAADPLARRGRIRGPELMERRFVLPRGPTPEESLRQFTSDVGFEPRVAMIHDQAAAIKELVSLGVGVSILPLWSVASDVRARRLGVLRLKDRLLIDTMGLVHRRSTNPAGVLKAVVETASAWREWLPISRFLIPVSGAAAARRGRSREPIAGGLAAAAAHAVAGRRPVSRGVPRRSSIQHS
jgi:LysR family hydrogen peroxide-inducible transcriptional activator